MEIIIYYGPPGSGKTKTLMDKLETELTVYNPEEIAYSSFTREGAYQGQRRAMEKFGLAKDRFPYFKTMHALIFKLLSFRKDNIMQPNDYKVFGKAMAMRFVGHYGADFNTEDDRYLFLADLKRNNPERLNNYIEDFERDKLEHVARQYRRFKTAFQRADFTDLIAMAIEQELLAPVKVAFLDEWQDSTTLQQKAANMLFRKVERLYIAGDDDQAIYTWSGADVSEFLKPRGKTFVLNVSYRLPSKPLAVAKLITAQIKLRAEKEYSSLPEKGEGVVETVSFEQLILKIQQYRKETWFVLFRTNSAASDFAELLYRQGHPFLYKGTPSLPEKILNILAIAEKAQEDRTQEEKTQWLELTLAGKVVENIVVMDKLLAELSAKQRNHLIKYLTLYKTSTPVYNIRVNTIHTVKGSEAKNVAVYLGMTQKTYKNLERNPDDEHRVFYVAVTRTENRLFLIPSETNKYEYPLLRFMNAVP